MTDQELQQKLFFVRSVIQDALEKYVGEPMTPETLANARREVVDSIIRLDMASKLPAVSNLVDVIVEYDPEDPTMMVIRFKRK